MEFPYPRPNLLLHQFTKRVTDYVSPVNFDRGGSQFHHFAHRESQVPWRNCESGGCSRPDGHRQDVPADGSRVPERDTLLRRVGWAVMDVLSKKKGRVQGTGGGKQKVEDSKVRINRTFCRLLTDRSHRVV